MARYVATKKTSRRIADERAISAATSKAGLLLVPRCSPALQPLQMFGLVQLWSIKIIYCRNLNHNQIKTVANCSEQNLYLQRIASKIPQRMLSLPRASKRSTSEPKPRQSPLLGNYFLARIRTHQDQKRSCCCASTSSAPRPMERELARRSASLCLEAPTNKQCTIR